MDFHIHSMQPDPETGEPVEHSIHVMSVHRQSLTHDRPPLRIISDEQYEYFIGVDRAYRELCALLAQAASQLPFFGPEPETSHEAD